MEGMEKLDSSKARFPSRPKVIYLNETKEQFKGNWGA